MNAALFLEVHVSLWSFWLAVSGFWVLFWVRIKLTSLKLVCMYKLPRRISVQPFSMSWLSVKARVRVPGCSLDFTTNRNEESSDLVQHILILDLVRVDIFGFNWHATQTHIFGLTYGQNGHLSIILNNPFWKFMLQPLFSLWSGRVLADSIIHSCSTSRIASLPRKKKGTFGSIHREILFAGQMWFLLTIYAKRLIRRSQKSEEFLLV